jgi:hypothetical protein
MNISQITNKNNIKSTLFQTLVILLHSLKVLTSKVISKDVKKANYFRFFCKILSKLCWRHVPCGDVIFFKSLRSVDLLLYTIPVQQVKTLREITSV